MSSPSQELKDDEEDEEDENDHVTERPPSSSSKEVIDDNNSDGGSSYNSDRDGEGNQSYYSDEDGSRSYYSDEEDGSRSFYSDEEDGSRSYYSDEQSGDRNAGSDGGQPSFGDSFANDAGDDDNDDDDDYSNDPNHNDDSYHQSPGEGEESRSSQRSGQRSFQEEDRSQTAGQDSYRSREDEDRSFYSDDDEDRSSSSDQQQQQSFYSEEQSHEDSRRDDRSYDNSQQEEEDGSYRSTDSRSRSNSRSYRSDEDGSYQSQESSFEKEEEEEKYDDTNHNHQNTPRDPEAHAVGNSDYSDDGYTDQESKHRSFASSSGSKSDFGSSDFEASFAHDADPSPTRSKNSVKSQQEHFDDSQNESFASEGVSSFARKNDDPPVGDQQKPVHDDEYDSQNDKDDEESYRSGDRSYSDRSGSRDGSSTTSSGRESGSFRTDERSGPVEASFHSDDDQSRSFHSENDPRPEDLPEDDFFKEPRDDEDQAPEFDNSFGAFGDNDNAGSFDKQEFPQDSFQATGGVGMTTEGFDLEATADGFGETGTFGAFETTAPDFAEDPFHVQDASPDEEDPAESLDPFSNAAPFESNNNSAFENDALDASAKDIAEFNNGSGAKEDPSVFGSDFADSSSFPADAAGDAVVAEDESVSTNDISEDRDDDYHDDGASADDDSYEESENDEGPSIDDEGQSYGSSEEENSSRYSDESSNGEIEGPLPGTSPISFTIKEPHPGKKTLMILCTMFPNSEAEAQDQDRAMKLCRAQGITPIIIMGQQKPPQRDELVAISEVDVFPQFFFYYRQRVEFIGTYEDIEQMIESDEFNVGMLDPSLIRGDARGKDISRDIPTDDRDSSSMKDDNSVSDQSQPSEFSRSQEDSRLTFTEGQSSVANSVLEHSNSASKASQEPASISKSDTQDPEDSQSDDEQDESLRSDFKSFEQQDESLRSKLSAERDTSERDSFEGSQDDDDKSGNSRSFSVESEPHSSQNSGSRSFGSSGSESEGSAKQEESISLHQAVESEGSRRETSDRSSEPSQGASTSKSPSANDPSISLQSREINPEEFENSLLIGEVFGQPNELFEDFKEKQKLDRVGEEEAGDEDQSKQFDLVENGADGELSESEGSKGSFSLEESEPPQEEGKSTVEGSVRNDVSESVDESTVEQSRPNSRPQASPGRDTVVKKKKKKKRNKRRKEAKSIALLDFAANVNDAMLDLEEQEELNENNVDSSAHRLLHGFDALLGIFLQLSDELELISTVATSKKKKDKDAMAPVQALKAVLSFADTFDQLFDDLKPIILDCFEEEPDEEMDELLYRLNSLVDLLCETTHRAGERQEWNERAETTYVTLLELMERDALDLRCYFDDVETPDQGLSANLHEAWSATGHIEELRALQFAEDPWIFRQICYEVMVSTDQWCPDTSMLMEICGIDPEMLEEEPDPEYLEEEELAPIPQAAEHILDKVNGDPLPRPTVLASILRRIIPPRAVTDATLLDHFTSIRNTLDSPLGLSATNIVSISSVAENLNDPESLGVGGMGKSTLAAMVAQHPDVRRYFIDGVVWVYVGDKELNYARYTQCLRELVAQLDFYQGVPLFAELLHTPGEPLSKRRRREEGFMIYARDTIAELLHDRSVLIILDDVCFEPDLDWFDFAPMPGEDMEDMESNCALLVTTRCRTLLPAADTVEVDMLDEADAITLLIQESGQLSHALLAESKEARSVVTECANHPLAVKSVGRWLNLKHATAGVRSSVEEIHAEVIKSMDKILTGGSLTGNDDMLYEIMSMSLSPAINGEPTNIIKFCLAAFILVFCDREYISDFALTEPTPIIPMDMAELLFETLLEMNESSLLQKGSLFYAQKKEAAVLIPEALSALGVLKVITYSDAEDDEENPEDEQKFLQVMHFIHHEYGEYLAKEDPSLQDLTKDAERKWNRALVEAYLSQVEEWDIDLEDAAHSYALEMTISHMIRGGMYSAAADLLADKSFVRGRLLSLGRENSTRRHIKDCESLFSKLRERRPRGSKLEPRTVMKQAYQALGSQLSIDDEEQSIEDPRIKDVEVARAHYEIGFSLAEKRCWDAAIAHWETSKELLEGALGTVEVVAGILYNIGVVYSEINEYEQALDSLKQCLRIRGTIHGEEHILYAHTIQKIGDVFLNMSDYHEAMESYNWALDVMYTEPAHHRVEIGEILDNKGTIHYSKGEIDEALQCHQEALRSKQADLGEDHPELAATYHHIGNCLSDQGNVDDAIAHFEEAIRLKELDPEGGPERDADVLTIEGILHNLEGNQEQGLECYEKSLQILVTKVPHRKEKVASLLHLIGCVYLMSGEQKKAMKLFEESLQARRKVLGFVHLDVASTLFNMAFLHQTRNRLDRALKCLEEALKIRQLRLPDSEKVAVTHEKIGSLARAIGKTKKAQIAFEEALRIRRLIHGEEHEAVATVLQELGDLMDDLGEYDSAMSYYIDALDIRRKRLGLDDIAVAETLYSMGYTLHNNDEPERALVCFEESLSIRRYQLGEDSREVGDVLNIMGFLKAKKGELDDALTLLWDSLRIRKLQEDHVKVSETLKNIGNVHREKQEQELAVECYEECLRIRRSELGPDHEKVADALIAMGNVESDMQNTDDAMRCYQEALKIRTLVFGEHDESVAAVLQFMGTLEFRANNHGKARDLLTEFIRIRRDNGTKNDGDYVNVLFMLGNIHKMGGQEAEAKLCWTEAYQVFQELGLAETNPQIAKVMNHLLKVENLEEQEPDQKNKKKNKKSLFGQVKKKFKKDPSKDSKNNNGDDGMVKVRAKGRKSRKGKGVQL
ncbi:expressed tetratricopeptide repeat protein [Nitzschia inconspicua]|uniref:Expressed tetratricopeptide repeat protein n=1 Tax=Nitzschia inconspicua TaxID=303405 RepID=A0A9K3LJE2_9STRA|nr:expressed tetratricopeptide repeat protein [Nitzschia inconspicua]